MAFIEIPQSASASVPTPANGAVMFADASNSGNFSIKTPSGVVIDLTANGGGGATGSGPVALSDLTDVNYGSPTQGQTLVYNSTTGNFDVVNVNDTEDITHAQLVAKRDAGELITGKTYRLTDYQSVNLLHGENTIWNGIPQNSVLTGGDLMGTHTSPTEVLLVKAVSNNSISRIAHSETFKDDIIYYDIDQNDIFYEWFYVTNYESSSNWNITMQFDGGLNKNYIDLPPGMTITAPHPYVYIYIEWNGGSNYYDAEWYPLSTGVAEAPTDDWGTDSSTITLANGGNRIYFDDLTTPITVDGYAEVDFNLSIGGLKGKVIRRIDTKNNIDVAIDWRNVKYKRYEVDLTSYMNYQLGLQGNHKVGYYSSYDQFMLLGPQGSEVGLTYSGSSQDMYIFKNSNDIDSLVAPIRNIKIDYIDNLVFPPEVSSSSYYGIKDSNIESVINSTFLSIKRSNIGKIGITNQMLPGFDQGDANSSGNGYFDDNLPVTSFAKIIEKSNIGTFERSVFGNILGCESELIIESYFSGLMARSKIGRIESITWNSTRITGNTVATPSTGDPSLPQDSNFADIDNCIGGILAKNWFVSNSYLYNTNFDLIRNNTMSRMKNCDFNMFVSNTFTSGYMDLCRGDRFHENQIINTNIENGRFEGRFYSNIIQGGGTIRDIRFTGFSSTQYDWTFDTTVTTILTQAYRGDKVAYAVDISVNPGIGAKVRYYNTSNVLTFVDIPE
jgi:hypothetical protein